MGIAQRVLPCFQRRPSELRGSRANSDLVNVHAATWQTTGSASPGICEASAGSDSSVFSNLSSSKTHLELSCRWRWDARGAELASPWSNWESRRKTLHVLRHLEPSGADVLRPLSVEVRPYCVSSSFENVASAMAGIRKLVAEFASQPLGRPPSFVSQPFARPPSSKQTSYGETPSHSFPEWTPMAETPRSWYSATVNKSGVSGDDVSGATFAILEPPEGSALASSEGNASMGLEHVGTVDALSAAAAAQVAGMSTPAPQAFSARVGEKQGTLCAEGDEFGARSFAASEGEVFSLPASLNLNITNLNRNHVEVEDYVPRQESLDAHEVT